MQARHRIPTIFNLSMVDVLCCALGCVILLWLVYFKEARERSVTAGQTNKELAVAKSKLDGVLVNLASAQLDLSTGKQQNQYLSGQLLEITTQRDQVLAKWEKTDKDQQAALAKLKDAHAAVAGLQKDVKKLESQDAATKELLAQKLKEYGDLTAKFLGAAETVRELESKIKDQKNTLALNATQAAELKLKLANAEKSASALEQQLAMSKAL
ncbi:MAG TPA: hypothetical protein VE988_00620, partial [Gemmataceae bacterium]|nr:hypothetical protein [Gemmataceae bacterium]